MTRRHFIPAVAAAAHFSARAQTTPTRFQIGCMTLPYGAFAFARAI